MSKTTELPDPLFAEIDRYAAQNATSPAEVLMQAWEEFEQTHRQERAAKAKADKAELLAMTRSLAGSLSLPPGKTDDELITDALLDKYGPL